jgi:hypothetical protein
MTKKAGSRAYVKFTTLSAGAAVQKMLRAIGEQGAPYPWAT